MEEIDLQRQDAFAVPGGVVPSMSCTEIWDHMRVMNPGAYFQACQDIPVDDRTEQAVVLLWLLKNEPLLYEALENILRAFQSAFHIASETRQSLITSYHRIFFFQNQRAEPEIVEESPEKPKQSGGKKRKRAPKKTPEPLPAELQEIHETIENSAKEKVAKPGSLAEHFYAQERFYDEFPLKDYRHFHKKNHTHYSIEEVRNQFNWEVIYHVNGPWDAEMLKEKLKTPGKRIFIIKKTRGADAEVMGYKVLFGEKKE